MARKSKKREEVKESDNKQQSGTESDHSEGKLTHGDDNSRKIQLSSNSGKPSNSNLIFEDLCKRKVIEVRESSDAQNQARSDKSEAGKVAGDKGVEQEQKVIYEWKPLKCNNCSGYGHDLKQCRKPVEKKWTLKTKGKQKEVQESKQAVVVENPKQQSPKSHTTSLRKESTTEFGEGSIQILNHKGIKMPDSRGDIKNRSINSICYQGTSHPNPGPRISDHHPLLVKCGEEYVGKKKSFRDLNKRKFSNIEEAELQWRKKLEDVQEALKTDPFNTQLQQECGADIHTVTRVKKIIENFEATTGLRVNFNKSNVYVARVSENIANQIQSILGFKKGSFPMKYLGMPISPTAWSKLECQSMVDKVMARIKCWTSKHLSYAGRSLLINAVLMNLNSYWASIFLIPQNVIQDIVKVCRHFLWGSKEDGRKLPLVAWNDVCQKKSEGGLNIKEPNLWNKAMITKQLWDLSNRKESLWVKWMHMYYIKGRSVWDCRAPKNSSWHWKKLLKIKEAMKAGISNGKWMGNGGKQYTASSGYTWLRGEHRKDLAAKVVWCCYSVPKHSFISWLAWKHRLNTGERLQQLNIVADDIRCVLCELETETANH
ncbi:OLC1v1030907C1 [Oldenlandia corymbosa var. corymbosa]|uniref:OLC1v1030907C1 n=1 Tax=Oldenlandia corymbosa var. corymbosa TaxID=529605 RepID=A0AAV1CHT7_OLDCO|nr:OLC1v1030907C1 [Oldenlandia corymbosa var. corymbosa]